MTLLHLSDPHFGTQREPVVHALIAWVNDVARPDVLMLSGDLTQRATAAQFAQVKGFIQCLRIPHVLTIPGNHDIPLFNLWARWRRPLGRYRQALGEDVAPSLDTPELLLLTLNTTRRWRHKHGELSPKQIDTTSARLRGARAEQLRIVVTHQPCAVPSQTERNNLVRGYETALSAWSRAGADLVLGGHIHWPAVIPIDASPSEAARRLWVVLAGTAVSSRIRRDDGNSCNLIHWDTVAGQCTVERWDFVENAANGPGKPAAIKALHGPVVGCWQRVAVHVLDVDRP